VKPGEMPLMDTIVVQEGYHLYTVALAILGDPGEAEDAVQETLLRAWRHWDPTLPNSAIRPWLRRICVNQCLDRKPLLQKLRRVLDLHSDVAAFDHAASRDPGLTDAYSRLSPRQRAVVVLHYHYGYTLDEAASMMGCRPGTARSHLARALAILRLELRDE
jgi:RNA polymerase sigma-70 factor, ECF subfamily